MIGCLMYLTATRPDIMFAVCAATRHQVTPKTSNLLSVKRIFIDYAGANGDRKSTTGGCQFLRRRLISWQCKKQTIVATSSCEAEYVAATSCCGQWFLFTFAGRVTFCWLFPIPAGDLVSAGHMLFLLSYSNIFHLCHSYSQTMAELHFNIDHNKVAYLQKPTESLGFHQIIDFMNASEVSLPDSVRGLVATIDGTAYTVTEASIRSALQLDDLNAIDTMTNEEIFAGLRDIGYSTEGKFTFFKNKFSPQWRFLIHTLIHCLSPKSGSWNQFSSHIAIALICLSTGRKYNFSNMIFNGMCNNVSTRTKFLMYPRFLQIILDIDTEDTTPYPAPLVTKKFFANMRRYQGPDMPLLAHMLNLGEPAFEQAQQHDVSHPLPSPVVVSHPSPDPMPSSPRQSLPPPVPFGPAPTSGVVSTDPILDIPSSSGPSEPVLETITSPFRDDDTGSGSFHESPPRPHPATLTFSPTRIATLEAELKATKILHRDTVVLFAKRIKKLESKLKNKKRKLVLSDSENEEEARQSKELDSLLDLANATLYEPSLSTTPSKPANPEQSLEQEISPTTLDAVLTLSQSKARARAATIIYKYLKKQKTSSGLDFTDADIPAGGLDSAGGMDSASGVDSAGGLTSAGIPVTAGPTVHAKPSSPLRDPSKGKAVVIRPFAT
nr:uncharacterized mitochondrial protein AtMg00810-like [Tanacetum cinerariifolium]